MTREEREQAIAIIRKKYLCVTRNCDIEKSCGKCDLMIPSKEPILKAYKIAIEALKVNSCENCNYFDVKDRYCKLLQINWLPNDFSCNKGEWK